MQFTPKGIDVNEVVKTIEKDESIQNAHHVHIWKLDDHQIHLEAHLDFNQDLNLSKSNKVIDSLEKVLHDTFDIEHATFQCEYQRDDNKSVII